MIHLLVVGKGDNGRLSEEMALKLKYEQTLAKEREVCMREGPSHREKRMCKGTEAGKRNWKRLVTK